MNSMNVKKGDTVRVLSGKDKGKEGVILRALPTKQRVVVEKVNMVKKAMRPTQQNPQGGIMSTEAAIHVSNVMVVCPECKRAPRGYDPLPTRGRDAGSVILRLIHRKDFRNDYSSSEREVQERAREEARG